MPIVVATLEPREGSFEAVLDVYRELVPRVHDERGCELFALHRGDATVTLIERWTTPADLEAHATGEVFADISQRLRGLLASRPVIQVLESVPAGSVSQGTLH